MLRLVIYNDGTSISHVGNYTYTIEFDQADVVIHGRIDNHERYKGWKVLLLRLAKELVQADKALPPLKRTHCPRGHAYDVLNTQYLTSKDGTKRRHCKACKKIRRWLRGRPENRYAPITPRIPLPGFNEESLRRILAQFTSYAEFIGNKNAQAEEPVEALKAIFNASI